jgi:hypothetical protein
MKIISNQLYAVLKIVKRFRSRSDRIPNPNSNTSKIAEDSAAIKEIYLLLTSMLLSLVTVKTLKYIA